MYQTKLYKLKLPFGPQELLIHLLLLLANHYPTHYHLQLAQ